MKLNIGCFITIVMLCGLMHLQAAPLIQRIINNSDIGFVIFEHSDTSSCSLANKHMIVPARAVFEHEFLLELGKPSVVLRPIYYLEPRSKEKIVFVNHNYELVPEKLQAAYELWKASQKNKKQSSQNTGHSLHNKKNSKAHHVWLADWVGLDVSVVPHEVEIFGYLINLSRVMIKNNKHQQVHWLSFSKGIFSQLIVELELNQSRFGKGIKPKMKLFHGEGGVCTDGIVERLH